MTPLLFRSLDMSKADIRNLYDTLGEVEENFLHILISNFRVSTSRQELYEFGSRMPAVAERLENRCTVSGINLFSIL